MSYDQFCEFTDTDIENISEGRISNIKELVFNKSRELGKSMKDVTKKVAKLGRREARQTLMALDIINKKILKRRKISTEEAKFLREKGEDLAKLIPLIAISGIPLPIPITPFLIAYGKKFGVDLVPKNRIEPKDFKDKSYNPIKKKKKKI